MDSSGYDQTTSMQSAINAPITDMEGPQNQQNGVLAMDNKSLVHKVLDL